MQSRKRNLADLSILGALTVAFALAWGSPLVSTNSARAQDQPQQPQQQPNQAQPQQQPDEGQAESTTFTGTIVKNGDDYILRDSSGSMYKLDDPDRAKPFEGKSVKVTGKLDQQANLIHVESIEGAEA
jgi:uncharacterized protein YdeI (BOF family)